MSKPQPTHVGDIHSAFLLLNLAFCSPPGTVWPKGTDNLPSGLAYAPPELNIHSRFEDMPWQLAHATLWHVLANLLLMLDSDDPEFVNQARIGWRRLRITSRLFRSIRGLPDMPQTDALHAVLDHLRDTRPSQISHARGQDALSGWAKRLRYAMEDLESLLGRKTRKWLQHARAVQSGLGAQRDLQMAAALARQHGYLQLVPHILRMNSEPF